MSVLFLCGNHPRHQYIAQKLAHEGLLAGLLIEQREQFQPAPPAGLSGELKGLFTRHFNERDQAEKRHFGVTSGFPRETPTLTVTRDELNSVKVHRFLAATPANLLLSYGVHMLSEQTLTAARVEHRWNIHGGLSPWYRGCITHFWPSYLLEPQMTGMTVHTLTQQLDHGPVIHQTGTELIRGDGLHDLACRTVKQLTLELPKLVKLTQTTIIHSHTHRSSGRLWRASDWRPEHLRPIYQHYGNRIVDLCLDGLISGREPELIRQW